MANGMGTPRSVPSRIPDGNGTKKGNCSRFFDVFRAPECSFRPGASGGREHLFRSDGVPGRDWAVLRAGS
jgi:hypothetical protein